ncbi:MAG: hypothetical protein PWQ09_600 [Candidatus Cloacimonadota bacterium]|jgi:hypothetical protein|nr:hypothetical protein [Candidatus Cloacimonadota bacterium]
MMKKTLIFCLLFLLSSLLAALEVTAYVNNSKIGLQDILKYTIEITGEDANKVDEPELPNLTHFRNLGSSRSSSSSYSIINGKVQSNFTMKFTYNLSPQKTGNLMLPAVKFSFKGKQYSTRPIRVTVVEGSTEPAPPVSSNLRRNPSSSQNLEDNLFLEASVNKHQVYESEPVILTYKIYTRYNIENMSYAEEPEFNGFWKEDIFNARNVNFSATTLNGVRYNQMLLRKIALFPTETGELEIEPLKMDIDIYISGRSFFDFGSSKRYQISSKPIKLEVKPLPTVGQPEDFSGAVGNFEIKSSVSKQQIQAGNSLTYTLEISGEGNLRQFSAPKLPKVNNLNYLDPEITTNINSDQISGKKIIKYLVIGQEKGNYTIPALQFSYFDTSTSKYKTISTKPYQIEVTPGKAMNIVGGTAQSAVRMEGSDIGFIRSEFKLKTFQPYYSKLTYWLVWLLALLTIPATKIYAKEYYQLQSDHYYERQKKAKKILRKYLKTAQQYANKEDAAFYDAVHTGFSNYLADKLKIPRGSSTADIIKKLRDKNLPTELIEKVKTVFAHCNEARFMPGGFTAENIHKDFTELKEIIRQLTKKLR